jgi:hypothetical protein
MTSSARASIVAVNMRKARIRRPRHHTIKCNGLMSTSGITGTLGVGVVGGPQADIFTFNAALTSPFQAVGLPWATEADCLLRPYVSDANSSRASTMQATALPSRILP